MKIVIFGLSISSSWRNDHAATYRGLVRELVRCGHDVLFLERERPWYADNRDLPKPPYGKFEIYHSIDELKSRFSHDVGQADAVIVGSCVPDGIEVGRWVQDKAHGVKAFYDIDTPVTLANVARGSCEYLDASLIPFYNLYLSFTGGPVLEFIENQLGSPKARPLYCSVDIDRYYPEQTTPRWDLGYLGTYSEDRQPTLHELLVRPATLLKGLTITRGFVVAGSQYPSDLNWHGVVERIEHLSPNAQRRFYNGMRFTLNVTRKDMIEAGYSPSARLFEAAACGTPIISDFWEGLESFFEINSEILVARSKEEVYWYLTEMPEAERLEIGHRARKRVLLKHTAKIRAMELTGYLIEAQEQISAHKTQSRNSSWKPANETQSLNQ